MACGVLRDLSIRGIACALPDNKVETTAHYSKFGKETVDKVIDSTGVRSTYRVLPKQTASDLCFVATEHLLKQLGWDKDSVDVLIFVSHAPDYDRPATACVLQGRLGLSKECMAFDISMGCSGFVYGMSVIGSIMQNPNIKRGLLLTGDMSSIATDPTTTSNMLFGDCGAATALERQEGAKDIHFLLKTDGLRYESLLAVGGGYRHRDNTNSYVYMDGNNVFSFSITDVVRTIKDFMSDNSIEAEDVDMLVLHQANILIMNTIAKKCKVGPEKLPIVIDKCGNTASSSIPLAIADTLYSKPQKGETCRIVASGYGLGLSWGVIDLSLDKEIKTDILNTDYYYDDGYYEE